VNSVLSIMQNEFVAFTETDRGRGLGLRLLATGLRRSLTGTLRRRAGPIPQPDAGSSHPSWRRSCSTICSPPAVHRRPSGNSLSTSRCTSTSTATRVPRTATAPCRGGCTSR
jgi:hypothetical protein